MSSRPIQSSGVRTLQDMARRLGVPDPIHSLTVFAVLCHTKEINDGGNDRDGSQIATRRVR